MQFRLVDRTIRKELPQLLRESSSSGVNGHRILISPGRGCTAASARIAPHHTWGSLWIEALRSRLRTAPEMMMYLERSCRRQQAAYVVGASRVACCLLQRASRRCSAIFLSSQPTTQYLCECWRPGFDLGLFCLRHVNRLVSVPL